MSDINKEIEHDVKKAIEINEFMGSVNAMIWDSFGFNHEHNSSTCRTYKETCHECFEIYQSNAD
jgi:hypothetical protein